MINKYFTGVFFFFLLLIPALQAQLVAGNSYLNTNGYIEYIYGDLPIIISAPHGGTIAPASIPSRTKGGCGGLDVTTVTDSYTQSLARDLSAALTTLLGKTPHVIICKLDREKIDLNREINEATCGNAIAQTCWQDYHHFIYSAKAKILSSYNRGLLIDLHGHGHVIQRNELGYNLSGATLRSTDNVLNQLATTNTSSIKNLSANNPTKQTHAQLINGAVAFGSLLTNAGYSSVPSLQDRSPASTDDYFSGGYTIERWGSRDSGYVDAIQIETPSSFRDTDLHRKKFADSLAVVIKKYLDLHYFPIAVAAKLQNFSASLSSKQVLLRWEATTDNLTSRFEVEKSFDGISFSKISEVAVTGAVGSLGLYNFKEAETANRKSFFRIKQIFKEGTFYYSSILGVSAPNQPTLQLIRNPVVKEAIIFSEQSGPCYIINGTGQVIREFSLKVGMNSLSVSNIPSGIYYLYVSKKEEMLKILIRQ